MLNKIIGTNTKLYIALTKDDKKIIQKGEKKYICQFNEWLTQFFLQTKSLFNKQTITWSELLPQVKILAEVAAHKHTTL